MITTMPLSGVKLGLGLKEHIEIAGNVNKIKNFSYFEIRNLAKRILNKIPKNAWPKINHYVNDLYSDKEFFIHAKIPYENAGYYKGIDVILLGSGDYLLRNIELISSSQS